MILLSSSTFGQYCDSLVPSFNVDLSASPNMSWTSAPVQRNGSCCGSTNPDVCLEFVITLNPNTIAINFQISSGAVPPGALFYQIDCGPITPVGSPICISGVGPHHLTFCKPGNNTNEFTITSYSEPVIGPDITLNSACQGFIYANYYNEPSISWTSIAPGAQGAYDGLLSCTGGCDTTFINAPANPPAYIDYLVCGSDIGGCNPNPICDTIRVNFVAPVQVDIDVDSIHICAGDPGAALTATASGGTAPYSYQWSTAETTSSIIGTSGTYWVQVTDASGCLIATDTAYVIQDQLILNLSGVSPDCFGNATGAVSSNISNGTAPYSYQWWNGPTSSNQYNLPSGTYTLTVTDNNGCQITDSITLVDPPLLTATITSDTIICPGANADLIMNGNGGTGNYNYMWSPTAEVTPTINVTPATYTQYSCTITDDNGCQTTLFTSVDVNQLNPNDLVANLSSEIACELDTVWLSGTYIGNDPTVTLQWVHCPACSTTNPIAETPAISTEYVLSATNACGQTIYDTVGVFVNPTPNLQIGLSSNSVCPDENVTFSNVGDNDPSWTYLWDFGDGNQSNMMTPVYNYYGSGSYPISLTVTDNNGCTANLIDSDTVVVHQQAVADFNASQFYGSMMEPDIEFYNNSINANTFYWDFGDGSGGSAISPQHTYLEAGDYAVTLFAMNQYGCNDSIVQNIHLDPAYQLYVPNAFTPDNDDFNGIFLPRGFGISDSGYEFMIFNRWGDLVFSTNNLDEGWNGTVNAGRIRSQDGVYTWVVRFRDETGGRHVEKGHVSLLK